MKLDRRSFMQALAAIGIGGMVPKDTSGSLPETPICPEIEPPPEIATAHPGPYGTTRVMRGGGSRLYCKKAGIKAAIKSISITREAKEVWPDGYSWRMWEPGPMVMECEISPIPIKRGVLEKCMFNEYEWAIIFNDGSKFATKGFLAQFGAGFDRHESGNDCLRLHIHATGQPIYQAG